MEIVGSVDTILSLYTTVLDRLKALRTRLERFQNHPQDIEELKQISEQLSADVDQLRHTPTTEAEAKITNSIELARRHLNDAFSVLNLSGVDVSKSPERPSSKLRRFTRTTRTEEALASARHHLIIAAEGFRRILQQLIYQNVTQNTTILKDIRRGLDGLRPTERDQFQARIVVAPNPENIVLDFESHDEKGQAVTYEGKLKQAILRPKPSPFVMVSDGKVTGATGGGGVGKSCAVRGLQSVREIRSMFDGGIYEISLGMNATTSKLIDEICKCVEGSGGELLGKKLRNQTELPIVLRGAAKWFEEHKVLFIVDDVWENESITRDVLVMLKCLLSKEGSQMVFTSRSSRMWSCASGGGVIMFESRGIHSLESKKILLVNADLNMNNMNVFDNNESFMELLRICGGLPVALSIAGQLVRQDKGLNEDDPFRYLLERLKRSPQILQEDSPPQYRALSTLLDETVVFLETRLRKKMAHRRKMSAEGIMQSFCVIEKQQFTPLRMLHRLWDVDTESETLDLMAILSNVGLVKQDVRQHKGRKEIGLRLHDLVHDHFARKAIGKKKEEHRRLLNNYVRMDYGKGEEKGRQWWIVDEKEDLYVYENVLRHLVQGDMIEEAIDLVLDPRWTVKQMQVGGMRQALDDYETAAEALRNKNCGREAESMSKQSHCNVYCSMIEALELIKESVVLASSYVFDNQREVWFQLYGRLIGSIQRKEIRDYLTKIRKYAEKPWIRCDDVLLKQAGGVVERSWNNKGKLECARFGQDDSVFAVESTRSEHGWSCNILKFEKGYAEGTILWSTECRTEILDSVISNDGNKVVQLLKDACVKIIDVENKVTTCLRDTHAKKAKIEYAGLEENGSRIIFAFDDHTIHISNIESTTISLALSLGFDSTVMGKTVFATFSPDGQRVAIGFQAGQVLEFDIGSGAQCRSFATGDLAVNLAYSRKGAIAMICGRLRTDDEEDDDSPEPWVHKIVIYDKGQSSMPMTTIDIAFFGKDLQWSPDGHFLRFENMLLDMRDVPYAIRCTLPPDNAYGYVTGWSADGGLVIMSKLIGVVDVLRVGSLRWCSAERIGERGFAIEQSGLELELHQACQEVQNANWKTDGKLMAIARDCSSSSADKKDVAVFLLDADGKLHCKLESKQSESWQRVQGLAWAGQMLAVARGSSVELWNTEEQRVAVTLRCSTENAPRGLYMVFMSDNACTVAATSYEAHTMQAIESQPRALFERFLLWHIRDSQAQPAVMVRTSGHPYRIACSADGSFTACAVTSSEYTTCSSNQIEVYDEHGSALAVMAHSRNVKDLSFDGDDNVLIQWHMKEHERVQFSVWRWRQNGTAEAQTYSTPYVRSRRYLHNANHLLLGTLDCAVARNEYNSHANAFVVIAEAGQLAILHVEN